MVKQIIKINNTSKWRIQDIPEGPQPQKLHDNKNIWSGAYPLSLLLLKCAELG